MGYTVQSADGGLFEHDAWPDALLTAAEYAVDNGVQTRICDAGDGVLWRSWVEGRRLHAHGPRVRFPARVKFRAGAPLP
jgi:hypothetical protein